MRTRYLWAALIVLSVCSIFIGVHDVSPLDLLRLTDDQTQVILISRIPRLIAILIAGVSMSIIGLIMQQLSRNKFVSPSTAGTMDSASLGLLVGILLLPAATPLQKMSFAFLFALAGTFVFMKILDRVKYKDSVFIPLVGMMYGGVIGSVTTFFAYKHDLLQTLGSWLHGDFSMVLKGRYELLYLSVPLIILAYIFANKFTVAGMGEDFSLNLGLNYKRVVNIGLVIVSLVCAVVILTVGTIPFLGLIIPNIVTIYQGDHLKKNLTHTALLGAVFLLFCDIVGRVVLYPYEISIGLTVGVLGSGIFLYLLMRRKAYGL
ncbi:iron complex transport system permease protein [Paenibacillus phyllosphaerae]|uniref:Iron complex transport system permease protein n=1 Tax=Paenibacillus phyllosphaerae TaxID=274593 RepID=A0A7W5B1D3_9BACL|nr:ABC transporter permease [Paenibacillus phyllosphaerae]MBB3112329.1 iron complex transport system permease protein [Paenibacillus phyllosphaerae]